MADQKRPVLYAPKNDAQRIVQQIWNESSVMFFTGPSGTGKTRAALFEAMRHYKTVWITRPQITVGNRKFGWRPGATAEKMQDWLMPILAMLKQSGHAPQILKDGNIKMNSDVDIQALDIAMIRGITVEEAVLIVTEAQNLAPDELLAILTRVGRKGKIVLEGDPAQCDMESSCLLEVVRRLKDVPRIHWVEFTEKDQVRDPLVNIILEKLRGFGIPT